MRKHALWVLVSAVCLATFTGIAANAKKGANDTRQFFHQISKDQRISQALNRLTFGPRPGDAAQVRAMGLKKWIELQLHPEQIPENPVLTAKLKELDTLSMSSSELVRNYPTPQLVKQMMAGQMPFPTDPDRRLVIEKLVARNERKLAAGGEANAAPPNAPDVQPLREILTQEQVRSLRQGTPQQRLAAFQALPASKQDDVIAALPAQVRQSYIRRRAAGTAAQDRTGGRSAAGGGARPDGRQGAARGVQQPSTG